MGEERLLSISPQINLDGISRTVGHLAFTTRRVFMAKISDYADLPTALFGPLGGVIAAQQVNTASRQIQDKPLETLLASSHPKVRFDYSELETIQLKLSRFVAPTFTLVPHQGKRFMLWGKRPDFDKWVSAVSDLVASGVPLSVSYPHRRQDNS